MSGQISDEKKKVTIYSVAHEAGVSLATVSRVINDSSLVKEETRKKVEDAIIKLGYRPNAIAQGLALKKTTTIALVIPDSSFLFIGKAINGLLDVAKIYKYNILLHTTSSSINEMEEIVDNIVKSRADGVIIYNDSLKEKEIETLDSFHVPMVYIGHKVASDNACSVYIDYRQAVKDIVQSYLEKGIDDIAFVEDRKNPIIMNDIIGGIKEVYQQHGKTFDQCVTIPEEYHNSYDFLMNYFANHKHQVVLTLRDSQAMAVLNTCTENGIRVPDDTDIICIIDSKYTDMVRPRISSLLIPSYDLGALAMRVMTKILNDGNIKERQYQLNYIFKPKGTTKR